MMMRRISSGLFLAVALLGACRGGAGAGDSGVPADGGAAISIDSVPAYGGTGDVGGSASVDPAGFRVALYVEAQGWWTKPTAAAPTVAITAEGSWSADITTDGDVGCDRWSTRIRACLIPIGVSPPPAASRAELPAPVRDGTYRCTEASRGPAVRVLDFAGHRWRVKHFDCPVGPGGNFFSAAADHVRVDEDGALHLRIARREGRWTASEVVLERSLGYGRYVFTVRGDVDQLDPAAVLGLFTWDPFADAPHRELDIEFSRWGDPDAGSNAQFVVQPFSAPGHLERFRVEPQGAPPLTTNLIEWTPGRVRFAIYAGRHPADAIDDLDPIHTWTFAGDGVPTEGREAARINLWSSTGEAPLDGEAQEIVLEDFAYMR